VEEGMRDAPVQTTNTVVKAALKNVLRTGTMLGTPQLRAIKKKAKELAFGKGDYQLHFLEATAAAAQRCGHLVRVFRWSPKEMILQLVTQARYEFGEVKKKYNAERKKNDGKKKFWEWREVVQRVNERCVCASGGGSGGGGDGAGAEGSIMCFFAFRRTCLSLTSCYLVRHLVLC
jgi:hypothetical protein